jgi:hypothetical protein
VHHSNHLGFNWLASVIPVFFQWNSTVEFHLSTAALYKAVENGSGNPGNGEG